MDSPTFGLQTSVTDVGLPEEWQALLASQASTLAALLSRMQTAVGTIRQRYAVPQVRTAQLQALTAEAERVLTAQARQHVSLERELVELRAIVIDVSTAPATLAARVRTLESAIEVLHANLATARQYLKALFPQEL